MLCSPRDAEGADTVTRPSSYTPTHVQTLCYKLLAFTVTWATVYRAQIKLSSDKLHIPCYSRLGIRASYSEFGVNDNLQF